MNGKTKAWINVAIAVVSVVFFILFAYFMYQGIQAVKEAIKPINTLDKDMSDGALAALQKGVTFKGQTFTAAAGSTKEAAGKALLVWFEQHGEKGIKAFSLKGQTIEHAYNAKEFVNVFVKAFTGQKALLWASVIGGFITWVLGIVFSIMVKSARRDAKIEGGTAGIVFAVFRITCIPYLITAVMSAIALGKASTSTPSKAQA